MTLISTGSTLTPSFSSHLIAALTSSRLPSTSRQTMPISSVTLAWRILVATLNFWLRFQINGWVMSLGGYISQRRCWVGELDFVTGSDFFLRFADMMLADDVSRRRSPG